MRVKLHRNVSLFGVHLSWLFLCREWDGGGFLVNCVGKIIQYNTFSSIAISCPNWNGIGEYWRRFDSVSLGIVDGPGIRGKKKRKRRESGRVRGEREKKSESSETRLDSWDFRRVLLRDTHSASKNSSCKTIGKMSITTEYIQYYPTMGKWT